jgi:hypothetical protein
MRAAALAVSLRRSWRGHAAKRRTGPGARLFLNTIPVAAAAVTSRMAIFSNPRETWFRYFQKIVS